MEVREDAEAYSAVTLRYVDTYFLERSAWLRYRRPMSPGRGRLVASGQWIGKGKKSEGVRAASKCSVRRSIDPNRIPGWDEKVDFSALRTGLADREGQTREPRQVASCQKMLVRSSSSSR